MVRTRSPAKRFEATLHAKKYFEPHMETQYADIYKAAGLLAFEPDTEVEPYRVCHPLDPFSEAIMANGIM